MDLLGSDERRDIAALKIAATSLPFLPPGTQPEHTIGEAVFAVTNASGLNFSATEGILSAIRPAAEIPGAGSGFTLLQFTAPIAPSSSGSALLDHSANVIGIITSGMANAGFAVPIQSILGLVDSGHRIPLGSGAALQLPAQQQVNSPQSSAAVANLHPKDLLKRAKTIYLHSKTAFLTIDTLQRALLLQKDWPDAGLAIITDPRLADVAVEIDRPLFTYVHTWVLTDTSSSLLLGTGKVTALDGTIASQDIAKQILRLFHNRARTCNQTVMDSNAGYESPSHAIMQAAVDCRTTSVGSPTSLAGGVPPSQSGCTTLRSTVSAASVPMRCSGWRTVVSPGWWYADRLTSSNPMTDKFTGTL